MRVRTLLVVAGLVMAPGLALADDMDKSGEMKGTDLGHTGTGDISAGSEMRTGMDIPKADQQMVFTSRDNFEIKGTVVSATSHQIVLERKDLPRAELSVISDQTKITLNGKTANAQELKAGQEVRARFQLAENVPVAVEVVAKEKMKGDTMKDTGKKGTEDMTR